MKISICYLNGIDDAKDQAAMAIAKSYGAELIGSGCWLHEPFERDLQWSVTDGAANDMIAELRKADFLFKVWQS